MDTPSQASQLLTGLTGLTGHIQDRLLIFSPYQAQVRIIAYKFGF